MLIGVVYIQVLYEDKCNRRLVISPKPLQLARAKHVNDYVINNGLVVLTYVLSLVDVNFFFGELALTINAGIHLEEFVFQNSPFLVVVSTSGRRGYSLFVRYAAYPRKPLLSMLV